MQGEFMNEMKNNFGFFRQSFLMQKIGISKKSFEKGMSKLKGTGVVVGPFEKQGDETLYSVYDSYNILATFIYENKVDKSFLQEVVYG